MTPSLEFPTTSPTTTSAPGTVTQPERLDTTMSKTNRPNEPSRKEQILSSPLPPYMGVRPPDNVVDITKRAVRNRDTKAIVWGFPLCSEWAKSRWEGVVKYDPEIQQAEVVASATGYMAVDSVKVWPTARTEWMCVHVDQEDYWRGWSLFFSFGMKRPPPDVVEALTEMMEDYGVFEGPDYYPRRL